MGKMGHMAGKHISSKHGTVIEAAQDIVKYVQKDPRVSKIALGKLDVHLPPTEWRIKFTDMRGGLRLQVRGTNSIQLLTVYTKDTQGIKAAIVKAFANKYKIIDGQSAS